MAHSGARRLNPRKLLLSKWTAVQPRNKEKHFIVSGLVEPLPELDADIQIELEAVHSKRVEVVPWQVLLDTKSWLQGWN